jgi:acetoin utilization deacetylase AcuC-like enzyme
MSQTGVVIDPDYLKHDPGEFHPERPERIKVLLGLAEELDSEKFRLIPPKSATRSEIELCHDADYISLVESTSRRNRYALDGDTVTSRDSFAVGLLAVGGFLRVLDSIAAGESPNGFALVRPPGHHALSDRAMGFCLFNTIAIGAEYLKQKHGAKRILIMDWDVHHGNGTQYAFYADPSVLFISTHQYPYYPGTGAMTEVGVGPGEGYTINVPLPAGCADEEYLHAFHEIIVPAANRFEPEWVLVSAGFDSHERDPLGGMGVSEEGFRAMARMMLDVADRFAARRIAFLLEGGYDLAALKNSVAAVLETMQQRTVRHEETRVATSSIRALLQRIHQVHEKYTK